MLDSIKTYLNSKYRPDNYILDGDAHGIYFDNNLVAVTEVGSGEIAQAVCQIAAQFEGVAKAVVAGKIPENDTNHINRLIRNGYYASRSSDIYIELKPGWIEWRNTTGTSHGSSYNYDTHVPVIFYGWNIRHGESDRPVEITDIAPTVSSLLNIPNPLGTTGKILFELKSK